MRAYNGPMQKKVEKKGGKMKEMIMVKVKEIIEKYKQGMQVAKIAILYKKSTSGSCLQKMGRKRYFLTSNEIKEMCKMWETVQNFVEKHHPNKAIAVGVMNLFNNNAMSHFREILKRRQNQMSLDRFHVKVARKVKDSIERD